MSLTRRCTLAWRCDRTHSSGSLRLPTTGPTGTFSSGRGKAGPGSGFLGDFWRVRLAGRVTGIVVVALLALVAAAPASAYTNYNDAVASAYPTPTPPQPTGPSGP